MKITKAILETRNMSMMQNCKKMLSKGVGTFYYRDINNMARLLNRKCTAILLQATGRLFIFLLFSRIPESLVSSFKDFKNIAQLLNVDNHKTGRTENLTRTEPHGVREENRDFFIAGLNIMKEAIPAGTT